MRSILLDYLATLLSFLIHQKKVQHQVNYSCTIPSLTTLGSHDESVPKEQVGEWKNRQDIGGVWSPSVPSMNHSFKSNVELQPHPQPDGYTMKDQLQNDSKDILAAGSLESFNSQIDSGLQKVSVLTLKQPHRDLAASLRTKGPSEFICKEEDTCWRTATNASTHDDLQLSIALAKQEIFSPTNPVEDRYSCSASGVPNRLGAAACVPQVPSMFTTNSSKTATINWHNTSLTDASSKPFDQHSELNNDPAFSSDTHQDREREYPNPTPKFGRKQTSMNQSGSTSVAPKDLGAKTCVHASISFVSESSSPSAGRTGSLQSLEQTSCLEERHSSDRETPQKEQLTEGNSIVKRENIVVNPISVAEGIAGSHVLESLTEKNCEKINLLGAESSENFMPTSTEEEQPQCSSPIALSPWGEQNYYQGEAVDSALWGVQDDHSNDMWSMHSPTPALQPSSGLGASGCQPSVSSAERSATVDGWQGTSSSLEGSRKASSWHQSVRQSSRANSTSGAYENNKSSSSHQATTPTANDSWEAPKKQENSIKNTVSWGEALGNNRSWNPSSGNASRGSQGGHNHNRYLHGSDLRRGNPSHSRRSDYRQDLDRGGSSRSLSRGQSQRGVCKYYEKGHCFKGNKCQYLHR